MTGTRGGEGVVVDVGVAGSGVGEGDGVGVDGSGVGEGDRVGVTVGSGVGVAVGGKVSVGVGGIAVGVAEGSGVSVAVGGGAVVTLATADGEGVLTPSKPQGCPTIKVPHSRMIRTAARMTTVFFLF